MSATPSSDSQTTSADTPSASSPRPGLKLEPNSTGEGAASHNEAYSSGERHASSSALLGSKADLSSSPPFAAAVVHPDFPDAKTLLISSKRPRSFLERTARELLAGGTDVIILSALGDAMPLCVQLQSSLEEKKAARPVKVETTSSGQRNSYTAGLRIYMRKHEEFKGSRISPGYVTFCPEEDGKRFTPIYEEEPKDRYGSVNAGDHRLMVGGAGSNREFSNILSEAGQQVEKYEAVHKELLEKAWKENEDKETDEDVRAVQLDRLEEVHSQLKLAMCRPCKSLRSYDPAGATGAVFVSAFKEECAPYHKEKNICMVYVVGPKGEDFPSRDAFLSAVTTTSVNLMTALCDYNGLARRQGSQKSIQSLNVCRVSLFSGGAFRHPSVTKQEVASAILAGLENGYRHGPAPRLNFAHDEDVFKQAWVASTGLDVYDDVQGANSKDRAVRY